jgi:hypothetical protein
MSNMDPTLKKNKKTGGEFRTPAVLLIYTVKSGKNLGSDRGRKNST